MQRAHVNSIAIQLIDSMRPFCERIAPAGSLRRRKDDCRDLELVAIRYPDQRPPAQADLFGEATTEPGDLLFEQWSPPYPHTWIKGHKPHGKYWQALLRTPYGPLQLDLFLTTPQQWGAILLIRTGPAEFSKAVTTHAKKRRTPFEGGYLRDRDGHPLPTPEEHHVFDHLNLAYVEPHLRFDARSLRSLDRRAA